MKTVVFQDLTDRLLDEAAALYCSAFNAPPWDDEWTQEVARVRLGKFLHLEDAFGLAMLDEGGHLCGIALGAEEPFWDGTEFWLKEFAIAGDTKGQGLGSVLMEELTRRLKQRGVGRVCLLTMHGRPESFYLRQGYREQEENLVMFKKL